MVTVHRRRRVLRRRAATAGRGAEALDGARQLGCAVRVRGRGPGPCGSPTAAPFVGRAASTTPMPSSASTLGSRPRERLRTPMGFLTGGDLDMPAAVEHFLDWWVVLGRCSRRPVAATCRSSTDGGRSPAALVPPRRRPEESRGSWPRPASCTSGCSRGDGPGLGRDGRRRPATSGATGGRGGPDPRRRRPAGAHAVLPAGVTDRGRAARRRPLHAIAGSPRRPPARQTRREHQPRRGAGEADRRRRGHLGRAVAQGLLARQPLVPCCSLTVGISVTGAGAGRASSGWSPARTGRSSSRRSCAATSTCRSSTCRPRPAT